MGDAEAIERILTTYRTWAVVGCSPDPSRASNSVARFLRRQGCRVVPVNPTCGPDILGEPCYPDLRAIPGDVGVEVVDIFRRSEFAGAHVARQAR